MSTSTSLADILMACLSSKIVWISATWRFSLKRSLPASTSTLYAKLEPGGTIIGSSADLNGPISGCCGQYIVVSWAMKVPIPIAVILRCFLVLRMQRERPQTGQCVSSGLKAMAGGLSKSRFGKLCIAAWLRKNCISSITVEFFLNHDPRIIEQWLAVKPLPPVCLQLRIVQRRMLPDSW